VRDSRGNAARAKAKGRCKPARITNSLSAAVRLRVWQALQRLLVPKPLAPDQPLAPERLPLLGPLAPRELPNRKEAYTGSPAPPSPSVPRPREALPGWPATTSAFIRAATPIRTDIVEGGKYPRRILRLHRV